MVCILCESFGINPTMTNNQATKTSPPPSKLRVTISGLWALQMEAIERHEWPLADSIKATIKQLEAAELREPFCELNRADSYC